MARAEWHSDHVRYWMYVAIEQALTALAWEERAYRCVEFGADGAGCVAPILRGILGERLDYRPTQYPDVDIEKSGYDEGAFDIAIADQVLEHVENPWGAAWELGRIVKDGGLLIVATPFIHPIHRAPKDYWRFTPDSYDLLFPPDQWQTVTDGMWGDARQVAWEYANNPRASHPVCPGFADNGEQVPGYGPETDGVNPIVLWTVRRRK